MALDLTGVMLAVFVFLPVAILTARVWQHKWVIVRLLESPAVALVLRHLVLCIGEVAVGTSPVVEGEEALGSLL